MLTYVMRSYVFCSCSESHQFRCASRSDGISVTSRWSVLLLVVLIFSLITGRPASAATARTSPPTASHVSRAPKDSSFTFPITPVGKTSTFCQALCFCSDPSNCTCDVSGTEMLEHSLAPPFSVTRYLLQPYLNGASDCNNGTPVQLPAFVAAGQQISFTVAFSPTSPGTFSDDLGVSGYTLSLSGSTPSGSPSLVPYQPNGWSAPVVVSDTPGTQVDSSRLTSTEPLYLSWAVQNAGDLSTFGTFYLDLYLDGAFLQRWQWSDPLAPDQYLYIKDYRVGLLSTGAHTFELVVDPTNTIGSSENYTKIVTIAASGPPPKPITSTSWYVQASGPYQKDSALYAWAFQAGQRAGQLNESSGGANFVLLDFGQPWKSSRGIYGASGFGRTLTVTQISNVVKQFVLGCETATQRGFFLAVGTSNGGPYVSAAHAQAWAQMLVDLDVWIAGQGLSVDLSSASDAELGFNNPKVTQAWFKAFTDAIARSGHEINSYDYGDAQACPTTTARSTPQKCGTTGWTQKDIADLFALYIPEIYNNTTALEWEQISLYTDLRSGQNGALIEAPLSELGACTPSRAGCQGAANTPAQAWRQLVAALRSNTTTSPGVQELLWSTDINWNTNKSQ